MEKMHLLTKREGLTLTLDMSLEIGTYRLVQKQQLSTETEGVSHDSDFCP